MLLTQDDKSRFLNRLRSFLPADQFPKVASDQGGLDSETSFEQAFSSLAHSYLRDKAPGLLDHEIGFQLLERNEDNTRAVGIFGFKVGPSWLYAPVFFLNGDLKGHELLYLNNQDLFCPLNEKWLNYLLSRKPPMLGEEVTRNSRNLGVLPPDIQQLKRNPYKFASSFGTNSAGLADWVQEVLPQLAVALTKTPDSSAQVPGLLKASSEALTAFLEQCVQHPILAKMAVATYGDQVFADAILEHKVRQSLFGVAPAVKVAGSILDPVVENNKLQIRLREHLDGMADGLTEKEAQDLDRDGYLIKDLRDEKSQAYRVTSQLQLENPGHNGLYELLLKPNTFERCLVLVGPYSFHGRESIATVVKAEGEHATGNYKVHELFHGARAEAEAFRDWFDKLPETTPEVGSTYVFVTPLGTGTVPMRITRTLDSPGKGTGYVVYDNSYTDGARLRPGKLPESDVRRERNDGSDDVLYFEVNEGHKIRLGNNRTMYVPKSCKAIKVSEDSRLVQPGNQVEFQLELLKKTSTLRVKVAGRTCWIGTKNFSYRDGVLELMKQHGFDEPTSKQILKEAEAAGGCEFRVKYANTDGMYPLQRSAPNAPSIPDPYITQDTMFGTNAPLMPHQEQALAVPDLRATLTDRSIYRSSPDFDTPSALRIALQAAQTGQKEVFDTSALGGLLKTMKQDTLVDRYLGGLMKGMDNLGRIYFQMLWHREQFEERYGKDDLPELEDSVRNAFEATGDVALYLRQRTVTPFPEEGDVELGDTADQGD